MHMAEMFLTCDTIFLLSETWGAVWDQQEFYVTLDSLLGCSFCLSLESVLNAQGLSAGFSALNCWDPKYISASPDLSPLFT